MRALPALAASAALALLAGAARAQGGLSAAEKTAIARLRAQDVAPHVRFLSDDLLEGRAPARAASGWPPATSPRRWRRRAWPPAARAAATSSGAARRSDPVPAGLRHRRARRRRPDPGRARRSGHRRGHPGEERPHHRRALVFVGYGIVAPEYHWDDYKDVDVKGKVVLVMNNDPESDPALFAGKTRLWYGAGTTSTSRPRGRAPPAPSSSTRPSRPATPFRW